jgi:hypothetical protein
MTYNISPNSLVSNSIYDSIRLDYNKYIMRDILEKLETLSESTGLANRKAGDVFRNTDGDEITFDGIDFYPKEAGRYDNEQLDHAVLDIGSETDHNLKWLNNRTGRTGGFAIAKFTGKEGPLYFGRYLEQIKADPVDNYIPNQIGDYKLASKAAAKAQSGLTPQDLLVNKIDLTADDILGQLAETLGTDNTLYDVAAKLAAGEPLPMTFDAPPNISFSAFRDYFCEILQPIALQMGQYTGNAGEAAEVFLGGSFQNTLISFDDTKTAGLSDSIMTNEEGKYIKVSTKGGLGAMASTANLVKSADELSQTENGRKLMEKYSETIEILREIKDRGQALAPIYLGLKYDIIDREDAKKIISLKNVNPQPMSELDNLGLSDNLLKLAKIRKTSNQDSVNFYYLLLAGLAQEAADQVNEHTDFSSTAADILNNGALIQVYTKASENKGQWTLKEFETVYPGESIKGVYLSAAKTYYSTGIKGNFTFKIDKGKGLPEDKPESSIGREKRTDTAPEFAKKAGDIALGRDKPKSKEPSSMGNVGREKRK